MAEANRTAAPVASVNGAKFLIVEARFYDAIADMLLKGARAVLEQAQAQIEVVTVPGALEIPTAIRMAYDRVAYAGVVALGCIIRGETYHFEIVSNESARALMQIATQELLPLGNGILTTENEAQAIVRADPAQADKGGDAARAALALYHLKQRR
jgi:6,7-dimethyl-8-ribityllumazine synthase